MSIPRREGESREAYEGRLRFEIPRQADETPAAYDARVHAIATDNPLVAVMQGAQAAGQAALVGTELAAGAGRSVFRYFKDLFTTLFARGASTDAMERADEALAVADVLMLAIAADGTITPEEDAALRAHWKRSALEDDRGAALHALAAELSASGVDAVFARVARSAVPRIAPTARREVYRAVCALAAQGSGVSARGLDRGAPLVDPDALRARMAALLGIGVEERAALEAEAGAARG